MTLLNWPTQKTPSKNQTGSGSDEVEPFEVLPGTLPVTEVGRSVFGRRSLAFILLFFPTLGT